jgi:hypothetical protein
VIKPNAGIDTNTESSDTLSIAFEAINDGEVGERESFAGRLQ